MYVIVINSMEYSEPLAVFLIFEYSLIKYFYNKTSLIPPPFLKCLYKARKVIDHIYIC